ncbi:MAG TPA: gamma-glutamylcyclotransferase family protein, partial [Candidatus Eisenbacteria bacterium]|nr:gamma-glutamylcyclotransferase family protein [Candidatus Eisenbacteria bacterium]
MSPKVSRAARRSPALFFYGSLMDRSFWRGVIGARAAASLRLVPARLRGWRRCWNGVRPDLGGAVLNLARDPKGHLWGGLVLGLSEETWAKLDEQESSHL